MSPLETTTTATTTHHVLDGWPRHRPSVKVLLQKGSARVEVAVVKLVRDTPSQRTKLSTLLEVWAADGTEKTKKRCSHGNIIIESVQEII